MAGSASVLWTFIWIGVVGAAAVLAGCSSSADRRTDPDTLRSSNSRKKDGASNTQDETRMRYYGGPKYPMWPAPTEH